LDTDKTGFSPQVYFQAPDQFIPMSNPSGQVYKATLTGRTVGATLRFAVRGAYAGGLVTSKFFEYIVGDNCTTLGVKNFTLSNIAMYPNPVSNELTIEAKNTIQKVEVFNLLGQQVLSINPKANSAKIQTSSLSKGVYVITATIDDVVSSSKFIKQ
jgi:hypothetical protein